MSEQVYDDAGEVEVLKGTERTEPLPEGNAAPEGLGCHSGSEMEKAARMAGSRNCWTSSRKDYPQGPHDKPQSMCPAFGSCAWG
jgi:chlorophyllide a reductase subunit Y